MALDLTKAPNRIPWPPLLFAGMAVLAILAERVAPTAGAPGWLRPLGLGLIAAGLLLDLWAMATMARARTNILPHRAADRLVTEGPFRWTRNPIYVGNSTLLVGIAAAWPSLWMGLAALLAAFAVHHLAVRREEDHLAARFGTDWSHYAAATPRWIGRPRPDRQETP
ncbi:MAG: methyltransferase family protein [Labrys sp. (in: a-proteobacteria)]|jgi:protein-S-isoprenylcysteine O-methyltransferase Ste14